MVYITGDLHGEWDRLKKMPLGRKDTLLVTGDFSFLWEGTKEEYRVLKKVCRLPFTILFVDGIHENFAELEKFPTTFRGGAEMHRLGKRVFHIKRGQTMELEGKTYFFMGGGTTPNPNLGWGEYETPSEEEYNTARMTLSCVGNKVDYIVTHEPPQLIFRFLNLADGDVTPLRLFLDEIAGTVKFSHWYFGSMHMDKKVTPSYTGLFTDLIPMPKTKTEKKK